MKDWVAKLLLQVDSLLQRRILFPCQFTYIPDHSTNPNAELSALVNNSTMWGFFSEYSMTSQSTSYDNRKVSAISLKVTYDLFCVNP